MNEWMNYIKKRETREKENLYELLIQSGRNIHIYIEYDSAYKIAHETTIHVLFFIYRIQIHILQSVYIDTHYHSNVTLDDGLYERRMRKWNSLLYPYTVYK